MNKMYIILMFFFCITTFEVAHCQVEHNYLVGPQSTDCDSLSIASLSIDEAISKIENSKFRFQQQFKISRTFGVMNARYYSCDGESGYLIMLVDKINYLYLKIPKSVWDKLITSSDINTFYTIEIKEKYDVIKN